MPRTLARAKRSKPINVRLTDAEHRAVSKLAEVSGKNITDLARDLLLTTADFSLTDDELRDAAVDRRVLSPLSKPSNTQNIPSSAQDVIDTIQDRAKLTPQSHVNLQVRDSVGDEVDGERKPSRPKGSRIQEK